MALPARHTPLHTPQNIIMIMRNHSFTACRKGRLATLTAVMAAAVLLLAACGTKGHIAQSTKTPTENTQPVSSVLPTEITADPNASTDYVSVKDAAEVLLGRTTLKTLATKHGYKTINGYAVYRLDSYDTMLYKNCQPAKKVGQGVYADTPQPLRKGISSYVAMAKDITIGVFNDKAYNNLVGQVKNGGFTLLEQGYEDHYTNGQVDAYCYASRRTVRLSKTATE